ncbi:MAG TPA: RagB/SusD family nutrient uptake outer membrane protein [Cyclobacteriaceae bacterium]|nr:RagB/SusD family nutrient uptake outer membrane protein [Cyclobacteriaceae bacterium]HMV10493.1 RagB/SusD family nutrient uptake outer membrane protein [Cyclobacteriaceae bacterium]HMX01786.1 RagB/SusD family nutrient uptake outer membrane protein [Cyclobacteriaceae bacterium]HMX51533.1 RagB/SusD family nutrient uptake outer membrane protein [Cyclobacteriaceae bacterium]HMY95610.1 RagB/SusD family nutrient uptake outer membrane protein [Cyclobacteriaceae bacterium]
MKFQNSKFIKVVLLTGFLAAGCSDFLDTEPQNKYLSINFYLTESQVFSGLIAAYEPLQWTFVNGKWTSSVMLGEIWSDNANAGGDPTNFDQPGWQEIDDLTATTLTAEARAFWTKYYAGINRANQVLNNVKLESEVVKEYQAEAKFLRAYYMFELFRTYGPMPIILVQPSPEDRSFSRPKMSDVFAQIEKDLLEAIPLLPLSYSAEFAGRATKGSAQALLGKAYLYWADLNNDDAATFDKAAEQLSDVITSNQYQLLDDYNQLYAFGEANDSESVFEIQYTNEVPADFGTPYQYINGNMMVQLCGIRGLCAGHPDYIEGWGFMLMTDNLYDSYLPDDLIRRNATIISQTQLTLGGCAVSAAAQNPIDFEGYWQKKYANYRGYTVPNGGEINVLKDANQPVIRYADVLLMYAEALERGNGSASEAMTYIDMVRERAAGPGDNTGSFRTAAELMTDEGWTLLEVIWYERRAELAGEGDRWFDLVRSGRADANVFSPANPRNGNFSTDDLFLPIPQRDVDLTGGKLTPYPDASLFE